MHDLGALGLDWDGAIIRQSERLDRHREAFETLRRRAQTYPCWCTRAEIRQAALAPHAGAPGRYPGTCARLGARERAARERSSRPAAWRLRADGEWVAFDDRLHGPQTGIVEDIVLWRGDGTPAYHLAVVVDDAEQGIGEVVRGDDLLEATAAQVSLQRRLGLDTPSYAHVPLVLGPDRARLAKRHGAIGLRELLAAGHGVEELVGWMGAGVGLCEPGEACSPRALLSDFDARRLLTQPTVLDPQALGASAWR